MYQDTMSSALGFFFSPPRMRNPMPSNIIQSASTSSSTQDQSLYILARYNCSPPFPVTVATTYLPYIYLTISLMVSSRVPPPYNFFFTPVPIFFFLVTYTYEMDITRIELQWCLDLPVIINSCYVTISCFRQGPFFLPLLLSFFFYFSLANWSGY